MKPRPISHLYCSKERKPCVGWIEKYFNDCLCNLKDDISFGCGLVSLIAWGVAEIPQIITNFQTKSGHGVSLTFLLTWIVGDIFNLLGCILEPATLPTQFYTALLYTISTVVLVWQCVYYDHICRWCKSRSKKEAKATVGEDAKSQAAAAAARPKSHESTISIPGGPHRASPTPSPQRESYYISARSLARSGTPPLYGSYLRVARSGPSAMQLNESSSSSDDEAFPVSANKTVKTKPIRIPRSVGYGTFAAASVNLPYQTIAVMERYMGLSENTQLQDGKVENNVYGMALGWLMAAIYMGGRIPQIWLNIKRGSVEGLNPLMFIFALIANVAYVGSIVVRSIEWEKIKANMPWLLDAVVCVALDLFIILQYIYYKYIQKSKTSNEEDGDYMEAVKPLLS
ncbi:probable vacuolar amino acid transporter YPQ1 [Macadamia integrifolia]|uniref:probable vacuolar amino acid transporter YPQ1 n=1 Tax=Macadamia integrifolia TaxID=60698 RepID=UPI001C4E89A2|nr:probable vacuolar amino acid transporter YPQ1 [Macadamia integrifolia]